MRQHQKKVYLPLAVIVTVTFVFFFGARGGVGNLFRPTETLTLEDRLIRLGHDLQSAGMLAPPPSDWYRQLAERERKQHVTDPDQLEEVVREDVRQQVRAYYREMGAKLHYLPVREARKLGILVSDEEVGKRVRDFVQRSWGISPFEKTAYREELSARSLAMVRFEELVEGRMLRERVNETLLRTAGASEAEQFYSYVRDKQRVRVQYVQRRPESFLEQVRLLPGKRPEKKPAEKKEEEVPAKKAGEAEKAGAEKTGEEDAGEEKAPAEKKKDEEEEEEVGTLYEEELQKQYEDRCKDLKEAYDFEEGKTFEWPAQLMSRYPDFFADATAKVEYLVARTADFRRGLKVTAKDIENYYENNKDREFRKEQPKTPPAKAGEKKAPEHKPLREVKAEIEKKLLTTKALDAAAAKLRAAVTAYNALAEGKRPAKLAEFAAKHKPLLAVEAGPATLEELEGGKYLGGYLVRLHEVFDKKKREKLGTDLTEDRKLDDDEGYLALRVAAFKPLAMLDYAKAKEGFQLRMKRIEAWKLAHKAIEADHEALKKKELPADRFRLSALLSPGDEVCQVVAAGDLAVGEASAPYRFTQLLGPEAEAEEKRLEQERKKKEAEEKKSGGAKKPERKPLAERIAESLDRGSRGYRVVILAERKVPSFKAFRADREWKSRWKPMRLPEWYARFLRQRGQLPGDTRWRETFLADLYQRKYERLMSRGE
jgi:hypothetical protein